MSELRFLNISINPLSTSFEKFGQFTKLNYLLLQECQIDEDIFPEEFGDMPNLMSLYLPRNNLTMLPESLGRLSELRSLDVS